MFEQLKAEWQRETGGSKNRLRMYVALLLIVGAVVFGAYAGSGSKAPEEPPVNLKERDAAGAAAPVEIDRSRLPSADDDATQSRWQEPGLGYLLSIADQRLAASSQRTTPADLAARPAGEARGGLFELEGEVLELGREEYPDPDGRLWTLVLGGPEGARCLVLVAARASEYQEGKPRDALLPAAELLAVGDRVLARGLYLQRRTGTFGQEILRDPVPVLVATPPRAAFRKVLPPAAPISELAEADWDEVKDRVLSETEDLDVPAIWQVFQWARQKGHAAISADLAAGKIRPEEFDQAVFERWSDEVQDVDTQRPFTDAARGRWFTTAGLLGSYASEGWTAVPRDASRWGVERVYILDLISDHYANVALRVFMPFPLDDFPDVKGERAERLRVTGLFVKNFTYKTRRPSEEGGYDLLTVPFFVVLHVASDEGGRSPYKPLIWIIAGAIVVLGILFYVVLVRGESKERDRMDERRRALRKRVRELHPPDFGPHGGAPPAPGDGG